MPLKVIASRRIVVDPGAETYVDLYTVNPGSRLRLEKVEIFFPSGTAGELLVKVFHGWIGLAPTDGHAQGDNVKHEYPVEAEYGSQSVIRAYLKNINTASARECVITLMGQEQ
jgi:hypothetical protein